MQLLRFCFAKISPLVGLFTTLFLLGCASIPNISIDKNKAASVKSMALLKVTESQVFTVKNESSLPGLVGGVLGAAIQSMTETNRSNEFVAKYNSSGTKFNDIMVDEVQRRLIDNGLKVTYLSDQVAKTVNDKDDYSHISTPADAILNLWFGPTGYIASGPVDSDFEPWLVVHARLLDGKTKEVLYLKTYTGGYDAWTGYVVFVPCGINHRYSSFSELMDNFEAAKQGLIECHKLIAQKIAADLK